MLKEKSQNEAQDQMDLKITKASALASLPQSASGGPNITLGDLVADVPVPAPTEKAAPTYEQACRFMKDVTDSMVRASFQNNLEARLVKMLPPATALVKIEGDVSWDWSNQARLLADFIGDNAHINGDTLTLDLNSFDRTMLDAYQNCFGRIRIEAKLSDGRTARLDNANTTKPFDTSGTVWGKPYGAPAEKVRNMENAMKNFMRVGKSNGRRNDKYVLHYAGVRKIDQTFELPTNDDEMASVNVIRVTANNETGNESWSDKTNAWRELERTVKALER